MDVICQIIAGDLTAAKVLRTDRFIAFPDHHPVFEGHVLISPIQHVDTWLDLPEELMAPLLSLGKQVAHTREQVLGSQGLVNCTFTATFSGQILASADMAA